MPVLPVLRTVFFIFLLVCGPGASVRSEQLPKTVIRLATLEWPPFSGESLPYGGSTTRKVREAFEAMGYRVVIDYLPWARALKAVREPTDYMGVFPAYASEIRSKALILSPPLGRSPLGFVEIDTTRNWNRLEDLSSYIIGTVESYANTDLFDDMTERKALQIDPCGDDVSNLHKLVVGRIDMAVIDKNVMLYFLNNDPALKPHKARFHFNPRILEEKELFVGFRRDEDGERLNRVFTEGLYKIGNR